MEPIAVNVNTAAKMTSLSPHTIRLYIRQKKLEVARAGRRIIIPVESLKKLLRDGAPSRKTARDEGQNISEETQG